GDRPRARLCFAASMRRSPRAWPLWTIAFVGACGLPGRASASAPARAQATVEYRVALPRPDTQYVHVRMRVDAPRGKSSDVAMPAWAPGSYLVRDFARHVYDLAATDT